MGRRSAIPSGSAGHSEVAFIGSYVPRRCGIATFTHDLASAVGRASTGRELGDGAGVQIVALNDRDAGYTYEREVALQVHQHRRDDYRNVADILSTSRVDAVSLQHEYGLFGGDCGDFLFEMLNRLRKPLVPTLHTVLSEPSDQQRRVLRRICEQSSRVVVMAERARTLLRSVYEVPEERIRLVFHGVPDIPFGDTAPFKERFGLSGRTVILSFGLLGPGKSIETMLDALGKVVPEFPELAYVVLGVTHPGVIRESGELYRLSLERRAVELGIERNVIFHNRYASNHDLREYLQAADFYVTPYRGKEQITSGTLAYALAAGKAILSTPYWHAQELLAEGRGCLVEFGDADGFADSLRDLLRHPDRASAIRRAAYDYGRQMIWPRVAEQYLSLFAEAAQSAQVAATVSAPESKPAMRLSLPEICLDHYFRMTDDTGMLQHSLYAIPDRRHGYCTDDNARALIVATRIWSLFEDEHILRYISLYLSFLYHAQQPVGGRFRNFMSYDRRWLEEDGSDDCQGRALWALGYLIAHAPSDSAKRLGVDLFEAAVPALGNLRSPRAWALAILGLHYYLRVFGGDARARAALHALSEQLVKAFSENESDEWPWFDSAVTYDNGRVPQALIVGGVSLEDSALIERGLHVLHWLLEVQTNERGHLSVIGNDGWWQRGGGRAPFDQQPIEPAAMISACKAAYRATGDAHWPLEMRRCFEWYLGRNDLGVSMIDFTSRGCYDGLGRSGVNENQGAESVLSWLLSLLNMHEIETVDILESA